MPNDVTRTMPNSLSRIVDGPGVPHFKSVNFLVLTKYTSALNGDSKPYFQPLSVARIGMFCVVSVYMPGLYTSASWPSLMNTAICPSRTVSLAPYLISLFIRSKRYTRALVESSSHSTISINSPVSFFQRSTMVVVLLKSLNYPLMKHRDAQSRPGRSSVRGYNACCAAIHYHVFPTGFYDNHAERHPHLPSDIAARVLPAGGAGHDARTAPRPALHAGRCRSGIHHPA